MQKTPLFIVLLAVFISYLTFAPPNKYLINIEPVAYSNELFKTFDGTLSPNNILSSAEHLFVDTLHGPESLAVWNDKLYTGTFGGIIVRIEGDKLVKVAKIGNGKCDIPYELDKCGRPLGLRFNSKGTLYVCDAYHGIYKIESPSSTQPKVTQLLPLSKTGHLKGGPSLFLDDITIDEGAGKNGGDVLYISDVSTRWDLGRTINTLVEYDKTGRLLRFDTDSGEVTTAGDNYFFPNGVQITDNKEAIIVCEFGGRKLTRTYIRGSKTGKSELFAKLPGECDNVRRSLNRDRETYWVAFASVRNSSNPLLSDRLSDAPFIRKFLVRLSFLTGTFIEWIGNNFNVPSFISLGYSLRTGMRFFFYFYASDYGMIAEVDANGKIVTSFSSPNGQTNHLSEVCEVKGGNDDRILYIGSYSNSYLGRLVIQNGKRAG